MDPLLNALSINKSILVLDLSLNHFDHQYANLNHLIRNNNYTIQALYLDKNCIEFSLFFFDSLIYCDS